MPKSVPDPLCAIVLGSGLGPFVDRMEVEREIGYGKIPGLAVSRVPGHAGRFVFGTLGGLPVVAAQGRIHLYEGRTALEVTAGIRYLASLGVKRLVLTNAAGTLNPTFGPGSWMLIEDQINLTGQSPLMGGAHFVDMSEIYSVEARHYFVRAAAQQGVALEQGIYAGVHGPQYETPAEVRMLRTLGADAVGMSTVLEAIQARALGMEVVGFSCLTNWAAGISRQPLSHEEVLRTAAEAAGALTGLLSVGLRFWGQD